MNINSSRGGHRIHKKFKRGGRRTTRDGSFQRIARGDGPFKSFRFNKCLAQGHSVGPSQLHWPILRAAGGYGWLLLLKTVLHVSLVGILMWSLSQNLIKLALQRAQQHKQALLHNPVSCKARRHFTIDCSFHIEWTVKYQKLFTQKCLEK